VSNTDHAASHYITLSGLELRPSVHKIYKYSRIPKIICLISGFCCDVYEICALLGCYAVCSGNSLLTFQDNISVPPSGVNKSKNKALFLDFFTFEDGTDRLS